MLGIIVCIFILKDVNMKVFLDNVVSDKIIVFV